MNTAIENATGILTALAVAAAVAGPALALNRRDRRIDSELRAAERGERADRTVPHIRYARAA
jgi:hypothetical protein